MKRRMLFPAVLAALLFLCAGCSGAVHGMPAPPKLPLDADGYYSGFADLPEQCTQEQAAKRGYYVRLDSQDVQNRPAWDDFVSTAGRGENAYLRIANFYQDGEGPYFQDIYYQNGSYYYFDSSAQAQKPTAFSYLLTLKGEDGIPKQKVAAAVLTSDRSLTFDDVKRFFYSSSREDTEDIPAFQLLLFR